MERERAPSENEGVEPVLQLELDPGSTGFRDQEADIPHRGVCDEDGPSERVEDSIDDRRERGRPGHLLDGSEAFRVRRELARLVFRRQHFVGVPESPELPAGFVTRFDVRIRSDELRQAGEPL